jgi:phenylacetate-CoA ligase
MTVLTALRFVQLQANQRRSPAAIRRLQEARLRALVRHAWQRVPFYRRRFEAAGITPEDVQSLDDLARLPVVTKSDLLGEPLGEILAQGVEPGHCRVSSSSGTTGAPITVYALPRDKTAMNLAWIRTYMANGMRPWDRLAAFIGQRSTASRRRWYAKVGVFPRREISAWSKPEEWVADLQRWRPRAITGYVMTLRLLAEFIRDRGIEGVRPRVLFHTSALLNDTSRRLFGEVFGCPVVDIYGSDEAGCIAWECPVCRDYHVNTDTLIVEVLKDGRPAAPGESGDVVITNLYSRAMPFIRYRQEDVVWLSRSSPTCGRPFPLIRRIDGRVEDFLVLRGGTRMPPHPFYHCIDPVPGVRRWRIVQERAGSMSVEIEAGDGLTGERLDRIKGDLEALTRGEMSVDMCLSEAITVDPGAKFRTIRSSVGGAHP